ncbi:MAG: DUF4346 domain-containing protein [DPANN group archaeon]|nr:DUF4346 domain-containing protein [DPANN group archaeon]
MKSIIRPIQKDKAKVLKLIRHRDKSHRLDPQGYFLIRINRKTGRIEVGFCDYRNVMRYRLSGKEPKDLLNTIIRKGLVSLQYHAAYLGRELEKARIALDLRQDYVQDEELRWKKKEKRRS